MTISSSQGFIDIFPNLAKLALMFMRSRGTETLMAALRHIFLFDDIFDRNTLDVWN